MTIPCYCFERHTATSRFKPETARLSDDLKPGSGLYCRRCGALVTDSGQAIDEHGAHQHQRTNPAGMRFRFGCFRAAPGCRALGLPSTEFSWFAAHSWQVAICAGCAEHLGWLFTGTSRFYALILDRLFEQSTPPN